MGNTLPPNKLPSAQQENPDELVRRPGPKEFLIVGLGASAGGVQALQTFFAQVPADSGIAYVVILHLSPDHDSKLAEILQTETSIPVTQVTEKAQVEPNHVYVVPPDQHLTMQDSLILVSPNTLVEERRAPVDIFFRTLAESHGTRAIAVILSGTGANGSMGLKRVKERGGAAFVQNPSEAEFNEMPRNAIATELVDDVLPVAAIPARILAYKEHLGSLAIPVEDEARPADQQQALRQIFTQLRMRTGHDFSNYKRPTLLRRIERRINVRNLPDLPAYAAFLSAHAEETQALLKDLLISVTHFFRDKQAFEALERDLLPQILRGKTATDLIRIWVVGCATGEEAYSIAMLCAEHTLALIDAPKVQIFATDIDEAAIAKARNGFYTLNDAADISPERLRHFFSKEGEGFRIRREIREMILFAHHNVIKDPPFSHLDLVTCRNLLIYLNHTAQERVMEMLHFALNPGGYLFLGGSESVDGASDLFAVVSRESHLFQSRQTTARSYPLPDGLPSVRPEPQRALEKTKPERREPERLTYGTLHQRLLEQYAPPSLIVNEEYEIVHLSERAGRYLQMAGGEPSNNILQLVREELRLELRTALYQAVQRRTNVEVHGLSLTVDEQTETLNIYVRPVLESSDPAHGFLLVIFAPTNEARQETGRRISDEPIARQLEAELRHLKTQLRAAGEQHELQSEELKAANEELQAMYEESLSSAEELETSREELQSINEELHTVNQELKIKVEEVSLTSNNLQNLINSTNIATIFLDRSLRVKLFTPTARELFNLLPTDVGRPLSDITHRLRYDHFMEDAELVLEKLQSIEREVQTVEGRVYLLHLHLYRTQEDRIQGVVLTFVEVTERKRAEEALRESEEQFRRAIEEAPIPVIMHAEDGEVLQVSRSWTELTGYALEDKAVIQTWLTQAYGFGGEGVRDAMEHRFAPEAGKPMRAVVFDITTRQGEHRTWSFSASTPGTLRDGRRFVVGMAEDITERQRAEEALQRSREELEARVEERTYDLRTEIERRQRAEAQRQHLLQRIVATQEEERRRLARELHDSLGQQLTALALQLEALPVGAAESYQQHVQELRAQVKQLDAEVDFLARELRPSALDHFGFGPAIQEFVEDWSAHFAVPAEFHAVGMEELRLPAESETHLYRITQEALNNIAKHAQATQVSVVVERARKQLVLIIEDNGIGFDTKAARSVEMNDRGLGLVGMQERASLIGATLEIESSPGVGTTIYVRVPLSAQSNPEFQLADE